MNEQEVEALVRAYQQDPNDEIIFGQLWRVVEPHIRSRLGGVRQYLPDGPALRDAQEEIFAEISAKLQGVVLRYSWRAPFSHYFNRFICNVKFEYIGRVLERREGGELPPESAAGGPGIEDVVMRKRLVKRALELYAAKNPRKAADVLRIFKMKEEEGYSWDEIGAALGKKPNTVNVQYDRMLKDLRKIIETELEVSAATLFPQPRAAKTAQPDASRPMPAEARAGGINVEGVRAGSGPARQEKEQMAGEAAEEPSENYSNRADSPAEGDR